MPAFLLTGLSRLRSAPRRAGCGCTNITGVAAAQVAEQQIVQVSDYNISNAPGSREASVLGGEPPPSTPPAPPEIESIDEVRVPRMTPDGARRFETRCKREYANNVHLYFINSVSACSDQASFLSADDLSIFLWRLERPDASQLALDLRPASEEQQTEVCRWRRAPT